MKFAINYSPQAEQLWRAGKIQVDLFKCPDWHDLVSQVGAIHKVYVHCSLFAGRGRLANVDFATLQGWLDTTDTLVINTHLILRASDFPPGEVISDELVIETILHDLATLGKRFGYDRIVIENVPHPTRAEGDDLLLASVDPAVISEVQRRSGCGLLLDLAHAVRVCEGTGRPDVKAYLNAMPVHALRELHIVGISPEPDENGIRHDHFAMTAEDWALAEWAIEQIRQGHWAKPDTLAFEYGGIGEKFVWRSEESVIAEQAPRLYQLAKSV